jgi:sec-independent protein translocase protein TatC
VTKQEEPPENDGSMTFWEHLQELRSRVIKMILAFAVGAAVAWVFKTQLLEWIVTPFIEGWNKQDGRPTIHFPHPAALFIAYIKLSVLGGFVISLPVLLYQVWAFVAPGLYAKEKRFAIPFVVASCALFASGGYFGWRIAFPMAFRYLLGFADLPPGGQFDIEPTVMIGEYIEFLTRMLIAFGAVFEIPVVVFFLSIVGVVNHTHLIKFARYFVVIAFILGAIITPPDPMSQLLLAVPLIVLYTFSIGIAYLFGKKKAKQTQALDAR